MFAAAAAQRSYSSFREDAIDSRAWRARDPEWRLDAGAAQWRG
jgi:hypothetical protein